MNIATPEQILSMLKLPQANLDVIITTAKYKCLGSIDKDGHWRGINRAEIFNVLAWEPV